MMLPGLAWFCECYDYFQVLRMKRVNQKTVIALELILYYLAL